MKWVYTNLFYLLLRIAEGNRPLTKDDIYGLRESTREMLNHAFNGYMEFAYPKDELMPISCKGKNTWGDFKLTLIDSLDTLLLTGDFRKFREVEEIVRTMNFDIDKNVSVFETNIRIVGGLLSSHLLYQKAGMPLPSGWPCKGPLLDLAVDVANRLLPAFNTTTGMPYGSLNLRYGVNKGETPITCTAAVGTYIIEFSSLSRLTGDMRYENVARRAIESLVYYRSSIGLLGNHIDTESGKWTATDSGIGAGVDSVFEYLVKGFVLLNDRSLLEKWRLLEKPIETYLNDNDWYVWASMTTGQTTHSIAQSLDGFYPGMKTLIGEVEHAMRIHLNYYTTWKQFSGWPEFYHIAKKLPVQGREGFPLRPEFIESTFYLYQATKDPILLEIGAEFLHAINSTARTECGFATVDNVMSGERADRMESFFIAETLKYLYLLFDEDNWINQKGPVAQKLHVDGKGTCIFHKGPWIFNTEAHPIDPSALDCCHKSLEEDELEEWIESLDLNDLYHKEPKDFLRDFDSDFYKCQKIPFYLKLSAWGDVFTKI